MGLKKLRSKARKQLNVGDLRILDKLKEVGKFMEGTAIAIEDLEKDMSQVKQAMVIYNKFIDLLNEKGLVTNEEIKEKLQKDGRLQVTKGNDTTKEQPNSDNVEGSGQPILTE